jgi:hypothetical protein
MLSAVPINQSSEITAPTSQNTPLTYSPVSVGLACPTVLDVSEDAAPAEETANVCDTVTIFGLMQGRLAGLLGKYCSATFKSYQLGSKRPSRLSKAYK